MREISLGELEVEIIKKISKWRKQIIANGDGESTIVELDAGDVVDLASDIAIDIIGHGVGIVGKWETHRKLSEGWED